MPRDKARCALTDDEQDASALLTQEAQQSAGEQMA
jgi:hypothetical protein